MREAVEKASKKLIISTNENPAKDFKQFQYEIGAMAFRKIIMKELGLNKGEKK